MKQLLVILYSVDDFEALFPCSAMMNYDTSVKEVADEISYESKCLEMISLGDRKFDMAFDYVIDETAGLHIVSN